jgi:hypothetical protein
MRAFARISELTLEESGESPAFISCKTVETPRNLLQTDCN